MRRCVGLVVFALLLVTACSAGEEDGTTAVANPPLHVERSSTSHAIVDAATPRAAPGRESTTTQPPITPATTATSTAPPPPSTAPPTAPPPPPPTVAFASSVHEIDAAMADRMTSSWREGCPVPLADLRRVLVSFWGFDGIPHIGELVVHADAASAIVTVFGRLFEARFPIERMEIVDVYDGSDDASMAANNTSAFNCRFVAGTSRWSEHAYGRAIDVNPLVNPYVSGSHVAPPGGAAYTDRSADAPGMIHDGDVVVQAFASVGWGWGGDFSSIKDYQHFSASGR
jgi:hypothetical protein